MLQTQRKLGTAKISPADVVQLVQALVTAKSKVLGWVAIVVSILGFGTALVFLKLECVLRAQIATHTMAMWYAAGFLLAGLLLSVVLCYSAGQPFHVSHFGLLAGALWGLGKTCMYYSVRSDLGLALAGNVQCGVNLLTTVLVGLLTGSRLTVACGCGMALVSLGLLGVLRLEALAALLGIAWTEARAAGLELPKPDAFIGERSGAALAGAAGILLGSNIAFLQLTAGPVWCFAVCMAIGQFLFISSTAGILLVVDVAQGRARLGFKTGLPAGLAGGAMLFLALTCNAFAAYHFSVAFTILRELALIVNGLWGIVFFKEITDTRLVLAFMGCAVVSLMGAALMTLE